jgi:hypothetical protein
VTNSGRISAGRRSQSSTELTRWVFETCMLKACQSLAMVPSVTGP